MKDIFDIAEAVAEEVARFLERTGSLPDLCRVSREIYRQLVEQKACENAFDTLVIGTRAVQFIVSAETRLRIMIDETLNGPQLRVA